jgi:hypothetical protein
MSIRNKNIHLLGSEIYDNSNKIFDIKYHQITNDLYLTDIKGVVKFLSTDLQISKKFKISEDSLLSIYVSSNGELFATFGSDPTLYLVQNNSKVIMKKTNVYSKVISKVCVLNNNSNNPRKIATSAELGEAEEDIGNENVQDSEDFEDSEDEEDEEDEEEKISLNGEENNSKNKEEADSKADQNEQNDNLEEQKEEQFQELENKSSNSDFSDSSSSNDNFKKKENIKSDNTIKIKALGKKRYSEWLVGKERRKNFFSDM